jgi:hypothetical protein
MEDATSLVAAGGEVAVRRYILLDTAMHHTTKVRRPQGDCQ